MTVFPANETMKINDFRVGSKLNLDHTRDFQQDFSTALYEKTRIWVETTKTVKMRGRHSRSKATSFPGLFPWFGMRGGPQDREKVLVTRLAQVM